MTTVEAPSTTDVDTKTIEVNKKMMQMTRLL